MHTAIAEDTATTLNMAMNMAIMENLIKGSLAVFTIKDMGGKFFPSHD